MGYKPLNDIQIKYIIDNYKNLTYNEMAINLNISKAKVVAQSKILKDKGLLNKKVKRYTWTYEEEQQLLNLLNLDIKEIAKSLNKRVEEIISKIKQFRNKGIISKDYKIHYNQDKTYFSLEISNWTIEEENKLLNNIKFMGLIKLSNSLNKSTFDTIMKYYELNSNNDIETYWNCKDYTEWNKEEDLYLVEHFEKSYRENIINNLSIKDWKKITKRAKLFGLKRDSFGTKYESPNERLIKQIFSELNFQNYTFQKRIDYKKNKFYLADFVLNDTNIILEAQGDYWHGNPIIYPNPSKIQLEKIENDKKRKAILENLGKDGYFILCFITKILAILAPIHHTRS